MRTARSVISSCFAGEIAFAAPRSIGLSLAMRKHRFLVVRRPVRATTRRVAAFEAGASVPFPLRPAW